MIQLVSFILQIAFQSLSVYLLYVGKIEVAIYILLLCIYIDIKASKITGVKIDTQIKLNDLTYFSDKKHNRSA